MATARPPGCFPAEQTAFPGPWKTSAKLPQGDWHVMANGRIYTLTITAVSGSQVTATLTSGTIEDATWDAATGTLTFVRVLPHVKQRFTGYLLHFDDADTKWRMAGIFGDVAVGPQSGWYATQPRS